jgi:predicted MFS family arabinose efflux permease
MGDAALFVTSLTCALLCGVGIGFVLCDTIRWRRR